ncbi:MAG: hypothetical protein WCK89_18900 [bacterium]
MKTPLMATLCLLCGCISHPSPDYFHAQLEPGYARVLTTALSQLKEPPLWETTVDSARAGSACRVTAIPTFSAAACAIVQFRESGDVTLRMKLCSGKASRPSCSERYRSNNRDDGLVFDESRILAVDDWSQLDSACTWLQSAAPTNFPIGFHDIFTQLDGTMYFLEVYRGGSDYRVLQINDPESITEGGRVLVRQVFPTLDVNEVSQYIEEYLDVLRWFKHMTQLSGFQVVVDKSQPRATPAAADVPAVER